MSSLASRVEWAIAPHPFCRDCADDGPRCPGSGELCDPTARAKEIAGEVRKLERQLKAAKSILWMAQEYAEAGGSRGPEMREYKKACEIIYEGEV